MASRRRKIIRRSIYFLLGVIVLAVIAIETPWFKNWLRQQVVDRTTASINGELRIGRLSGSLWTGVMLDDVELIGRNGSILRAAHIRVRYDPFLLVRGRWVIDRVEIRDATIRLVEDEAGWNVTSLGRSRETAGGVVALVIHDISLTNSAVVIDPLRGPERVLSNVALEGGLRLANGQVSVDVEALRAHDNLTGLTLREFHGEASQNFRVFDATFVAHSPPTRLAGTVKGDADAGGRTIRAQLDVAKLDLAQFINDPTMETDITGQLNAAVELDAAAAPPRATFAFTGTGVRALGYAADRLAVDGTYVDNVVTFDADANAYAAHAKVNGTVRLPAGRRALAVSGRGTYSGVDLRRLPASLRAPRIATRLTGRFDADATTRSWRVRSVLADSTVEGATLTKGTTVDVRGAGGAVTYQADGGVRRLDVQRVGTALDVGALQSVRYRSDLSGSFDVSGDAGASQPARFAGRVLLTDSTISGTSLPRFSAVAYLTDRRLTIFADGTFEGLNRETLATPEAEIRANGSMSGWVAVADIDRPFEHGNVEASMRVDLRDSLVRDVTIQKAHVRADVVNDVVALHALDIESPEATIRATGSLPFSGDAASAAMAAPDRGIKLTAGLRDRQFIQRLTGRPILAIGDLETTITGSVESPSADGTLTLYRVAYDDRATALTLTSRFDVEWPERDTARLTWKMNSAATFVTLGSTEIPQVTATADGNVRDMAITAQLVQRLRSVGVEGRLTLRPESQSLVLSRLGLETANVAWSLAEGQSATVSYAAGRIDVTDFTLVRDKQQIAVSGGFDIGEPSSPARTGLTLEARDVELADVNQILLGTRQLAGRINGTATVTGSASAPVVDVNLSFRDGTVEGVAYELFETRGRYAERSATFEALLRQSALASLRASGSVPFGTEGAGASGMDVRITGSAINLGLLQAFTTEINDVTGEASVDLRVTGTTRSPLINGTTTIAKGGFVFPATGAQYSALEASLAFTGTHMDIRKLQIADADGDLLTATGGLDVLGTVATRALDIDVRGSNFRVLNNDFGDAEIDAAVRVSGEFGAPVVRGTLTLDSGRLEVANILERTAKPYSTTALPGPTTEKPAPAPAPVVETPLSRADIELQLILPDNLVLRGRGLRVSNAGFGIGDMNIVTGGTFAIVRKPGGPLDVTGALEVVRGTYTFQGRRFDIERGSDVRFRGGPLSDPVLNVDASREVSGITAQVRLRGTARAPEIELASRPQLDESDILSLIVFNQPINALGNEQRTNLAERAAVMAVGAVATPLSDSIARALNLDLFEIQLPSGDAPGAVTVGGQLGSRVFVGLTQQFGAGEASLLTLEYRITEALRFVTSIARGTLQAHATRRMDRSGVDLIFLIRY